MRVFSILFLLMFCTMLMQHCSDPVEPPVRDSRIGDPVETGWLFDTTTHDFSWEYYFFGNRPVVSSYFRDIHIDSDTNIWMVGHVRIDTVVYSIRHGYETDRVTAVQWNGKRFIPYAIEGVQMNGTVSTMSVFAVGGKEGSTICVGGLGFTQISRDTMVFHDMRVLNGKWWGQERTEMTRSGRQFIFGEPGFLAELKQDVPLGPMRIEEIDLPTEVSVRAFTEAAPDDYYIGCWWNESLERHFYRLYKGEPVEIKYAKDGIYSRDFCTALWSSEDRVFAACVPFLYHQSITDTSDRGFININENLGVDVIGLPYRMKGRANNDIFIVGDVGSVIHYNGKSFRQYDEIRDRLGNSRFYDVELTDDHVYIVGYGQNEGKGCAVLIVGTRK